MCNKIGDKLNLQQYLYEHMQEGGRNPGLLKKYVGYLEDNLVDIDDFPGAVDKFLDELNFSRSTKRNYKSSCNKFVGYVYRREGLFLPNKSQENNTKEDDDDDCATITISSTTSIEEVEEYKAFLEKYEKISKGE